MGLVELRDVVVEYRFGDVLSEVLRQRSQDAHGCINQFAHAGNAARATLFLFKKQICLGAASFVPSTFEVAS